MHVSSPKNASIEENRIFVNNNTHQATETHSINIGVYIQNPFLQHTTSENNFTDTISTNKPHISINVANEKIPVDNDVQTNSYTPTKTKSELSKYL